MEMSEIQDMAEYAYTTSMNNEDEVGKLRRELEATSQDLADLEEWATEHMDWSNRRIGGLEQQVSVLHVFVEQIEELETRIDDLEARDQ